MTLTTRAIRREDCHKSSHNDSKKMRPSIDGNSEAAAGVSQSLLRSWNDEDNIIDM